MKLRWIGIAGLIFVLAALVGGSFGPSLWPAAFWSGQSSAMIGPGMMNGTMGPGMMNGGMMNGMMGPGMMSGQMGPGMMNGGMMGQGLVVDQNAPFDQRFLDQMLAHHQMAVTSAQRMIADSARPELRDLAQRIITGQQREIDQMREWRQKWYGAPSATLPGMMSGGMMSGAVMSRDQMRQMMGASTDFDRMFLQMMIPHHEAAIAMAEQALTQAQHSEIKTLAQSIITTQRAEIGEMQGYLQ